MEPMALMKRARLKSVKALANFKLHLCFVNDANFTVNFRSILEESKGLQPLTNAAVFATAQIIPGEGWEVVWPKVDIQIGADTLWLDAQAQCAPDENTRIFAQWRARHGLSLTQAAQALGVTPRTISAYGSGNRPVPRYMALACKGWEALKG
jgi:DNA-binding XRE family transcriptional regulator